MTPSLRQCFKKETMQGPMVSMVPFINLGGTALRGEEVGLSSWTAVVDLRV